MTVQSDQSKKREKRQRSDARALTVPSWQWSPLSQERGQSPKPGESTGNGILIKGLSEKKKGRNRFPFARFQGGYVRGQEEENRMKKLFE